MSLLELQRGVFAHLAQNPELAERPDVREQLEELERLRRVNPLQFWEPHSEPQLLFMRARTAVVAAFAGNRFGKTTSLVVRSLIDLVDRECLPEHLRAFKRFDAPCSGWVVVPTTDKLYDTLLPAFEKWVPREQLFGGKWEGAWSKERRQLLFANGSRVAFKTYEQHPSTLGGAALHFVGYDEPPPKLHREECVTRLIDYGGYEMFAMTPLKTNTGWIRRDIFKQRESPDVTVIRGSMHDNPLLDEKTKNRVLGTFSDVWRQAREFGDFVDVGGLIYPDFDRCVVQAPFTPSDVKGWDVVVGIDPGIRNAGIVWVGFDQENVAFVFAEALLQDKTVKDYASRIRKVNKLWGLEPDKIHYVCDPAARQRGQTNAETVLSLLAQEGVYCNTGQNDRDVGFNQLRQRMEHGRFYVSPDCRGLRDEADDYAAEEPSEGKDDSHMVPVKGNDHRLDALRYAVMERLWDPVAEQQAPENLLGWQPDEAPASSALRGRPVQGAPLGFMS